MSVRGGLIATSLILVGGFAPLIVAVPFTVVVAGVLVARNTQP